MIHGDPLHMLPLATLEVMLPLATLEVDHHSSYQKLTIVVEVP